MRLGPRGAAVEDGEGLVVLDARNLALLLRQEGRGRVFFAGHPVPQSGAAGSAGRGAERIDFSHGGQFNGTDTDAERHTDKPTDPAPGSSLCGGDYARRTSWRSEKAEAEILPPYPVGLDEVGEPKR